MIFSTFREKLKCEMLKWQHTFSTFRGKRFGV